MNQATVVSLAWMGGCVAIGKRVNEDKYLLFNQIKLERIEHVFQGRVVAVM